MADIGSSLARVFAGYDPLRQFSTKAAAPTFEDIWRQRLAGQGAISKPQRTLGEAMGDALAAGGRKAGLKPQTSRFYANRLSGLLNDFTPVGNVTGAEEGGGMFAHGVKSRDLKQAAIGAGIFGLSMLPFAGGKTRPLKGILGDLVRNDEGAIRAWHGSPHDFDKFDMSKIGTGEGAQAYGHGLYFAENPEVAKEYRSALSGGAVGPGGHDPIQKLPSGPRFIASQALDRAEKSGLTGDDALRAAMADIQSIPFSDKRNAYDAINGIGELLTKPWQRNKGRLYEVNINAEPEDFLDWDAPLAQQPNAMRALGAIGLSHLPQGNRTRVLLERAGTAAEQPHYPATGRELLNAISGYGEQRAGDLQSLQPYGIKGLRYLDQGSRGAAQGTRNFVVPDASLIDILNKY